MSYTQGTSSLLGYSIEQRYMETMFKLRENM